MKRKMTAILAGATALVLSTLPALSFGFSTPINDCIVTPQESCFDILFAEFSERVELLEEPQLSDSYAAIPAAILLKADLLERAEQAARQIENTTNRDELLAHVGAGYARNGMIAKATQILEEVDEYYARATLITSIAAAAAKDTTVEKAVAPLVPFMPPEFADAILSDISRALIDDGRLALSLIHI